MKNKLKPLTSENLQKAYDEGCSDTKKVLENLHPDFFKGEETYRIGNRLDIEGGEYLICRIDPKNHLALIALDDGNSWNGNFKVKDDCSITHKELTDHVDGSFTKIN